MEVLDNDYLVGLIRQATTDVFATMLGLDLVQEPAYIDRAGASAAEGVLSFVGLAGTWAGTGAIGCTATMACTVCSQMLMSEYTAVNDDVLDALAELTNMIVGNVKTRLEDTLGPMGLSIPTVIYGRNFTSRSVGTADWVAVPFTYNQERLTIHLCMAKQTESRRTRIAVEEPVPVGKESRR